MVKWMLKATHLVHKQTTAAVRAMFWMATVHACARLMDSGLEVNQFVKVRSCRVYVCICVYTFAWFVYTVARAYGCEYQSRVWLIEWEYIDCVWFSSSAAVQCGNLSSPVNGQVNVEGNTFGSQANYSCSEGYVLNGNSTRMCQSDGRWSGSEATCEGQVLLHVLALHLHIHVLA